LDIAKNTVLELWLFSCFNNSLPLSVLFAVSEKRNGSYKRLGTQSLHPLTVSIGSEIDYSDQNIFNGIYTQFTVTQKDDSPASESDYTITNGKITFHRSGNYTITMTNEAIISYDEYPAKVIVEVEVGDVGNEIVTQDDSKIKVYPNPTHNQLRITNYKLRMKDYSIYSMTGQMVMQGQLQGETTILNVSTLTNGVYFMKINDEVMKFVKQ
jgi:hypothetical protein